VRAYILVRVDGGSLLSVLREVKKVSEIKSADAICGPYDLIAVAEASDLNTLGKFVVDKIQSIKGVNRTLTCPVAEI
jgi:DNA-binding Lrp family transcriptional regulator